MGCRRWWSVLVLWGVAAGAGALSSSQQMQWNNLVSRERSILNKTGYELTGWKVEYRTYQEAQEAISLLRSRESLGLSVRDRYDQLIDDMVGVNNGWVQLLNSLSKNTNDFDNYWTARGNYDNVVENLKKFRNSRQAIQEYVDQVRQAIRKAEQYAEEHPALAPAEELRQALLGKDLDKARRVAANLSGPDSSRAKTGETALMVALNYNYDYSVLQAVLDRGANPRLFSASDQGGQPLPPLVFAARYSSSSPGALTALLRAGAAVDEAAPSTGATALMEAAAAHDTEALRILLAAGANARKVDNEGNGVFFWLVRTRLYEGSDFADKLAGGARVLKAAGADINQRSPRDASTPLNRLAANDSVVPTSASLQALIDQGARADLRDDQGRDALGTLFARHWGQWSPGVLAPLIQTLVAAGADPNQAFGKTGDKPLELMIAAQQPLDGLLARGVRVGEVSSDRDGETSVLFLLMNSSDQTYRDATLKALLAAGASASSAYRSTGTTPLMLATLWGDETAKKLLLAAKADPKAKDNRGRTAADYAPLRVGQTVRKFTFADASGTKRTWPGPEAPALVVAQFVQLSMEDDGLPTVMATYQPTAPYMTGKAAYLLVSLDPPEVDDQLRQAFQSDIANLHFVVGDQETQAALALALGSVGATRSLVFEGATGKVLAVGARGEALQALLKARLEP